MGRAVDARVSCAATSKYCTLRAVAATSIFRHSKSTYYTTTASSMCNVTLVCDSLRREGKKGSEHRGAHGMQSAAAGLVTRQDR